ncbi:MAG: polysaccharide biosynthesis C-terminal domain-containing protein [Ferruginibacter sp.]
MVISLTIRLFTQLIIIYVYARRLNYVDYGTYQSIWLYINVISVIGLFGLPSLLFSTSIIYVRSWIKENSVTFFVSAIVLNFLPFIFVILFGQKLSALSVVLLGVVVIAQNISVISESISIKNEKEKLVLASNIIYNIGYLLCHLLILYIGYSLNCILIAIIILYIIKSTMLIAFNHPVYLNQNAIYIQGLGRQWFYLGVNDTISVLYKWMDKWTVLLLISVTQFALYFNGSYEIPIFGLMLSAVGNIMLVELSRHTDNSFLKTKLLFTSSSLLLASVTFPCFSFLLLYHTEVFTIIFSQKYNAAIPIFVISIFIIPVRITNYTALLQINHKSGLIVQGAVIDLFVAATLMFILYPIFKMNGLALAVVISTYIQAMYYLWKTSRLLQQKITSFFPLNKLSLIMLISVLSMYFIHFLFQSLGNIQGIVVGILATGLLCCFFLFNYLKEKNPLW